MSRIFLIGMMGAGKTHWSRVWGAAAGLPVIDMDEAIAQRCGKSVRRIFNEDGEAAFRELERNMLSAIIDQGREPAIIACGGGTPFFYDNMSRMKAAGCVVYLEATITELMAHLAHDAGERPLLDNGAEERLRALLGERKAGYEAAHHIVPVKSITATTFDEISALCTNRHS